MYQGLIQGIFDIGIPILGTLIWVRFSPPMSTFFSVLNPVYSFNSSDLCQVLNIKEEAVFFLCLSRIALVSLG